MGGEWSVSDVRCPEFRQHFRNVLDLLILLKKFQIFDSFCPSVIHCYDCLKLIPCMTPFQKQFYDIGKYVIYLVTKLR